jgi:hypothetical protein
MRGWISEHASGLTVAILSTVIGGLILHWVLGPSNAPVSVGPGSIPLGPSEPGPATEATLSLSRSSGPPGTTLSVSGGGFTPGELVRIRFHATEVAKVQADAQGAFSGVFLKVPPDWKFRGRTFQIVATGATSIRSVGQPFDVT